MCGELAQWYHPSAAAYVTRGKHTANGASRACSLIHVQLDNRAMKFRLSNALLLLLALIVFVDALVVSRYGKPDIWISSACIIALVMRGMNLRQQSRAIIPVAFSLTLWVVANNSGLLESSWGFWTLVGFVLAIFYALWEKLFP
jgi:hypothetical protein